jgi:hypothetical protein
MRFAKVLRTRLHEPRHCVWTRWTIAGIAAILVLCSSIWNSEAAAEEPILSALVANDGGSVFQDVQRDAVLVGVRITVDKGWGRWDAIYSIQPIFRKSGGDAVRGEIHGGDHGLELVSEAKPGYVVGRIEVAKGGMIDGMRCVFVRDRDGKIDSADTYLGRWMGSKSESKPAEISGDGKYAIGLHGRCGGRLDGIGLVFAPSPSAGK